MENMAHKLSLNELKLQFACGWGKISHSLEVATIVRGRE